MPIKQSIALKIFGLALLLLLLTIALAFYLLVESARTRRDMDLVVRLDLPLADTMAGINESGLRRRLAFERWFGALNAAHPNAEVVGEASANYALFTAKLQAEFATARQLLAQGDASRPQLAEIRLLIDQIEPTYASISKRQAELLELQRRGEHDQANQQLNVVNDMMRLMQDQRSQLQNKMTELSLITSAAVASRQQKVQALAIAATISTVLLGLVLAAIITQRLTQPVRSLVNALRAVQAGDLAIQVPVASRDEVGVLAESFNYFVRELRAKEQIKLTFGKYVDPRVVEYVLRDSRAGITTGDRRIMTVLFADLVGFTTLAERLTPSLMVTVLNRHFGLQALAIQANEGVVDKFIGDSVMAFFGPPFSRDENHAGHACRAALAQLGALDNLRRELPELTGLIKDGPTLELRVGVTTGDVVVGNIGSDNTRSYTVIGDTVNLASRIESVNRIYGTRILLAEATARAVQGQLELREIDTIAFKGKTNGTIVYELLAAAGQLTTAQQELRTAYARGLQAYRVRDWDAAEHGFQQALAIHPNDGPARVMLDRATSLRLSPPGENWNGIHVMTGK